MTVLLDVNVLIALIDPLHSHHQRAHDWFASKPGFWASCPITLNGVLRIIANPRYSNPMPSVVDAADLLADLCRQPGHMHWPCDLNLLDSPLVDRDRLLSPPQITDTYLLALAVQHGGRLASFDRRLVVSAVCGGVDALWLID